MNEDPCLAAPWLVLALAGTACAARAPEPAPSRPPEAEVDRSPMRDSSSGANGDSAYGGEPLTVTFYDSGQALVALVTLPDGRRLLVNAGESPSRGGCGQPCRDGNQRVLEGLARDLGDDILDLVWITHQHSDHLGGVPSGAGRFPIVAYVDNGQSLDTNGVMAARAAATEAGADLFEVGPGRTTVPLETWAT